MSFRRLSIKDDHSPYIIYYPYPCLELPPIGVDIPDEGCQTVSIDVGYVNFAIRIEVRYRTGFIKPIFFHKINFTEYGETSDRKGTTGINPQVFNAIIDLLKTLLPILNTSRIVGIERQLAINYKATRIFQHVLTFFMLYASSFKYRCIIMDIDSKLKGQMLDVPKGLNGYDLKKWAIEKAKEILSWRGDISSIEIITKDKGRAKTKGDDLSDTIIQMEAWFIYNKGIITQRPETLYL